MSTPVISAIVPVYNVAPYLRECLDSLVGQSLQNIEIICVDDGSTDGSAEILDDYAQKDDRVKVIHQQNQGVSVARNVGIDVAKGKYLSFVDGDDYLDCSAYEEILQNLGEAQPDIVIFRNAHIDDGDVVHLSAFRKKNFKQAKTFSFLVDKFSAVIWNKLYRREFINKNSITFPFGVLMGEDTLFNLACFAQAPMVHLIDKSYYFYRRFRPGSTMCSKLGAERIVSMQQALENSTFYATLSPDDKLVSDMVVAGAYYNCFLKVPEKQKDNLPLITRYIECLKLRYSLKTLNKIKRFQKLVYLLEHSGEEANFISVTEKLFSIKNSPDKQYKIIRFLGIKFQIKRHKKTALSDKKRKC